MCSSCWRSVWCVTCVPPTATVVGGTSRVASAPVPSAACSAALSCLLRHRLSVWCQCMHRPYACRAVPCLCEAQMLPPSRPSGSGNGVPSSPGSTGSGAAGYAFPPMSPSRPPLPPSGMGGGTGGGASGGGGGGGGGGSVPSTAAPGALGGSGVLSPSRARRGSGGSSSSGGVKGLLKFRMRAGGSGSGGSATQGLHSLELQRLANELADQLHDRVRAQCPCGMARGAAGGIEGRCGATRVKACARAYATCADGRVCVRGGGVSACVRAAGDRAVSAALHQGNPGSPHR